MQLPDMHGLEVLHRLRACPGMEEVPVVALSAGASPDEVAAARDAGAVDCWTKPIAFDVLVNGIGRLLQR